MQDSFSSRRKIDETTNNSISIDIPEKESLALQVLIIGRGQLDIFQNSSQSSLYKLQYILLGNLNLQLFDFMNNLGRLAASTDHTKHWP